MALDISDIDVLARFDTLVENGIIYYGPTNAIPLLDKNFPVSLPIFESKHTTNFYVGYLCIGDLDR